MSRHRGVDRPDLLHAVRRDGVGCSVIDRSASIARLVGQAVTIEMAAGIVDAEAELDRLRARVAELERIIKWNVPRGLARRPPGRDR